MCTIRKTAKVYNDNRAQTDPSLTSLLNGKYILLECHRLAHNWVEGQILVEDKTVLF